MNFGYKFILVCAPGYNFTLSWTPGKCGKFKQSQLCTFSKEPFWRIANVCLKDIQQGIREAISEIYSNGVCNITLRGRR